MKIFTSPKQKVGLRGEQEAELFLMKHGFAIIEKNFSTRFGEIDVIAQKENRLHFIEIKAVTVSHETGSLLNREEILVTHPPERGRAGETNSIVSRETFIKENKKLINPFQNISKTKVKRLIKTVEIYLSANHVPRETRWQLDGIGVYVDPTNTDSVKLEYLENLTVFS